MSSRYVIVGIAAVVCGALVADAFAHADPVGFRGPSSCKAKVKAGKKKKKKSLKKKDCVLDTSSNSTEFEIRDSEGGTIVSGTLGSPSPNGRTYPCGFDSSASVTTQLNNILSNTLGFQLGGNVADLTGTSKLDAKFKKVKTKIVITYGGTSAGPEFEGETVEGTVTVTLIGKRFDEN